MTNDKGNRTDVGGTAASDLRDTRGGARDRVVSPPTQPLTEQRTPHQDAQRAADVRPQTQPADEQLPEGLRRERTGPINPTTGRSTEVPSHVPQRKP